MTELPPFDERLAAHRQRQQTHEAEATRLEQLETRISGVRLVTFLVAAGAVTTALTTAAVGTSLAIAGVAGFSFLAAIVYQSRVVTRRLATAARAASHGRHIARTEGAYPGRAGDGLLEAEHPYALDIDLVGPESLLARLDTTHTSRGARALAQALGSGFTVAEARRRQQAVRELAALPEFRVALEVAAARRGSWEHDLDDAPFLALIARPSTFARLPWLKPVMWLLPLWTLGGMAAARFADVSAWVYLVPLVAQVAVLRVTARSVHEAIDWLTARLGFAEAFVDMMEVFLSQRFESPLLGELQAQLRSQDSDALTQMRRLARYEGYAQFRMQGPVYLVVNVLTLWDLFLLDRIESFNRQVGPQCATWFEAVGTLECLCSLAALAELDPQASFPDLNEEGELRLEGLAHPLLSPDARVANDVHLEGPGSAWVVTGSNMAGKSTLLRAVGLSIALGQAGGPVIARRGSVPQLRLRASMRIDDSLQRGASYFRAELTKLQGVVQGLHASPPVFFLLDEVLRGTNSRARSVGARAVVQHLLHRSALGLVATHDASLADLEEDPRVKVTNCHFTDVFEEGEMRFDYRLRPGVVQSSNALRLLRMAGIEVDDAELEAMDASQRRPHTPSTSRRVEGSK